MDAHAFSLTRRRAAEEAESGAPPGPLSAMFKFYATELNKTRYEMMIAAEGFQALGWEGDGFDDDERPKKRARKAAPAARTTRRHTGNVFAKLGMLALIAFIGCLILFH